MARSTGTKLANVSTKSIQPSPWGIRATGREHKIPGVDQYGILEPIMLRPMQHGYEVVFGDGRLHEAKKLGFKRIPAIIHKCDGKEALILHGLENIGRENLNAIALGKYFSLLSKQGFTPTKIAKLFGGAISRPKIVESINLWRNLTPEAKQFVADGKVPVSYAERIMDLLEPEEASLAIVKHAEGKLNLREKIQELDESKAQTMRDYLDWKKSIDATPKEVHATKVLGALSELSGKLSTTKKEEYLKEVEVVPAEISVHATPTRKESDSIKISGEEHYNLSDDWAPLLSFIVCGNCQSGGSKLKAIIPHSKKQDALEALREAEEELQKRNSKN